MKLSIGFKIAVLCVVLVVVTVATIALVTYKVTKDLLVEQLCHRMEAELYEQEGHLQSVVRHLRADAVALAGDARTRGLPRTKDAIDEQQWRKSTAEAFRTDLEPRQHYLELCLLRRADGAWSLPVHAWRGGGKVKTSTAGESLEDKALLRLLPSGPGPAAAGPRLGPIEVDPADAGPEPSLVVWYVVPVYRTPEEAANPAGYLAVKLDFGAALNSVLRRQEAEANAAKAEPGHRGPPLHKVRYVADEHGALLATSEDGVDFRPAADRSPLLQQTYPGLASVFTGPDPGRPLEIDHRSNADDRAGVCLRVNLDPDQPDRFAALAVSAPYPNLVAQLPNPPPLLFLVAGVLTVAAAGLAFLSTRFLTRPLRKMTEAAESLAEGKFDVSLPAADDSEVGSLARSFGHMVEELRKRSQSLQESEARIRAILKTAAEGIIAVDHNGIVESFNHAAERIFGYKQDEVRGHSASEFLAPSHLEEIGGDVEKFLQGNAASLLGLTREHLGRRKDGSTFPMEVSASAATVGGRTLFTYIVRDITERKRAEAHVRQFNENLERRVQERTLALEKANDALEFARDQALEANRAKSAFLAQMSHELRTPLNAIIGYGELLEEEVTAEGQTAFVPDLRKIVEAGKHLLTVINDILDLSKLEVGKIELSIEPFELTPLLTGITSTVQPLAEKNRDVLELRCPPQLGGMRADPTRVRQVLFNLLSNACKFTKAGRVVLEAEREAVGGADWIVFRVRDNGRGIKPENLRKIFQPFEQGDAGTSRDYGGTGLGLSISRRFCQMMGGTIDVESEWGKGSTFTVRLPAEVRPQNPAPAPAAAAAPAPAPAPNGSRPILVVDDDLAVRDLLQRFLSKEGFQVLTASSGEEGLRLAKQLRPSAITLDVLMPGMDGWNVLTALKNDPETSDIPVVILTIMDNKNLGHALGAADYLTKPVDRERLAALLRRFHGQHDRRPILLVEDDADTRAQLGQVLTRAGWSVVEAVNAREALEQIRREPPALILLDLMMAGTDGFELVAEVRQHPQWRSIPVVVLTAKELSEEDRLRLTGSLLLSGCVKRVLHTGAYRRENLLREVRELMAAHAAPVGGPGAA